MDDRGKTKAQLISELNRLRERLGQLEALAPLGHLAEANHHKEEIIFREVTEAAAAAIFIVQHGHVWYINRAGEALLGLSREQLSQIKYQDLVHPDFWEAVNCGLESVLSGGQTSFIHEIKIITADRGNIWVSLSTSHINYKGDGALLMHAFDISTRKQSEATTSILFRISNAISITRDLNELLVNIQSILKEIIQAPNFFISLLGHPKINLKFPFHLDDKAHSHPLMTNVHDPTTQKLLIEVIGQEDPIFLNAEEIARKKEKGQLDNADSLPQVWLGVPLKIRSKTIGAMAVQHYADPFFYQVSDIDLMVSVSEQIALAVDRQITMAQLRLLATTDGLTNLYNRRYFLELSSNEFQRAKRYRQSVSLMMIDVDYFKSVNDKFGHDTGDRVLKTLASLLKNKLRQVDIIGRIGGEEFAVLLPATDLSLAREAAERLRQNIQNTSFNFQKIKLQITVSIGLASINQEVSTLTALIKKADEALYSAKLKGRNRVETRRLGPVFESEKSPMAEAESSLPAPP